MITSGALVPILIPTNIGCDHRSPKDEGPGYTMDHEVIPVKIAFLHGPTFRVRFLIKYKFTKPLGPSVGVNQIWTKRNDHAPKNECVVLKKIYVPKRKF